METKVCYACRKEVPALASVCPFCRSSLGAAVPTNGAPGVAKKKTHWAVGCLAVFLGLGVFGGIVGSIFGGEKKTDSGAVAPSAKPFAPDPNAKTLISDLTASRDQYGGVIVSANAALPDGTDVMINFGPAGNPKAFGQAKVKVSGGRLVSPAFTIKNVPWSSGTYQVAFFSRFDGVWQTTAVRAITGEGGANLSRAALKSQDPDLPASAQTRFELDVKLKVELDKERAPSGSPEETAAITKVKAARLTLPGSQGRSHDTVGVAVKTFASAGSFISDSLKWTAEKQDGIWTVTFSFVDRGLNGNPDVPSKAQWSLNPKTGEVKYLDKNAKNLSWTPSY